MHRRGRRIKADYKRVGGIGLSDTVELIFNLENNDRLKNIFGNFDENIKLIEESLTVRIVNKEEGIKISGAKDYVEKAEVLLKKLELIASKGDIIKPQMIRYIISIILDGDYSKLDSYLNDALFVTARGKLIKCKTHSQKVYTDAIKNNTVVFGVGPAGTGKTYLAIAMAVQSLKNKSVNRIILTRPVIEAGEKLGFLPGDLQEKINPYLRPVYDSLYDIIGQDTTEKYIEKGIVEIAPLAYMRGRTLSEAFIILDEAQNTTHEQMKMFLTRIGFGSKTVITGDVTQIDIPRPRESGLIEAVNILNNIEDISIVNFSEKDIVRHELIQKILEAYYKNEEK